MHDDEALHVVGVLGNGLAALELEQLDGVLHESDRGEVLRHFGEVSSCSTYDLASEERNLQGIHVAQIDRSRALVPVGVERERLVKTAQNSTDVFVLGDGVHAAVRGLEGVLDGESLGRSGVHRDDLFAEGGPTGRLGCTSCAPCFNHKIVKMSTIYEPICSQAPRVVCVGTLSTAWIFSTV